MYSVLFTQPFFQLVVFPLLELCSFGASFFFFFLRMAFFKTHDFVVMHQIAMLIFMLVNNLSTEQAIERH